MDIIVKIPSRQAELSPNMALSTFAEKPLISENLNDDSARVWLVLSTNTTRWWITLISFLKV